MLRLTDRDVARARTASLLLADASAQSPLEVAEWFGAMQAQDYASGVWSFGVRLPGTSLAEVEAAVSAGAVLRTWPMRGTLHFVAARDTRWLLQTTGARHLQARLLGRRWDYLGLDATTADLALRALADALQGRLLTRAQALESLREAGIDTSGQRGYHLLWFCAQKGLTCVGPNDGAEQTFALLDEWAPDQRILAGDEALAELAVRYFRSHGPTTRQDFAGWAGITAKEARTGIAGAGSSLQMARHGDRQVWSAADLLDRAADVIAGSDRGRIRLLPSYDEFLLGYKDRSIPVPQRHADRIVPGSNGVFQATITRDGRVLGTWRRSISGNRVDISALPFGVPSQRLTRGVRRAADAYADFLGLPSRLRIRPP